MMKLEGVYNKTLLVYKGKVNVNYYNLNQQENILKDIKIAFKLIENKLNKK